MKVAKEITEKKIVRIKDLLQNDMLDRSSGEAAKVGALVKSINATLKEELGTGVSANLISKLFHEVNGTTPRAVTKKAKAASVEMEVVTPGDAISNGPVIESPGITTEDFMQAREALKQSVKDAQLVDDKDEGGLL